MNPSISEAFEHMPLKSSRARKIKAVAKAQWDEQWSKGTGTSNVLRRITRRTGVKAGPKLYNTLHSRNVVATLIRLRTGHCGLKQYLHRFKKADTPHCECRQGKETVEHYLLECRKYTREREELLRNVGPGRMRVEKLLDTRNW